MNCYAPLFVNVHHEAPWQPDLIGYDAASCFGFNFILRSRHVRQGLG